MSWNRFYTAWKTVLWFPNKLCYCLQFSWNFFFIFIFDPSIINKITNSLYVCDSVIISFCGSVIVSFCGFVILPFCDCFVVWSILSLTILFLFFLRFFLNFFSFWWLSKFFEVKSRPRQIRIYMVTMGSRVHYKTYLLTGASYKNVQISTFCTIFLWFCGT